MFRRILLSSAATLAMIASASAADLPSTKGPPVYAPPPPAFSWTGIYVGGNGGYGWGQSSWCTEATFGSGVTCDGDNVSHSTSGWLGGGQVGARYQVSNFIFGAEGMLDATGIDGSATAPTAGPGRVRQEQITSIYSVTGIFGGAWDRFAIYAKGGWAGARSSFEANNLSPGGDFLSSSAHLGGWTAGAGVMYAVTDAIDIGVEYNYYNFGHSDIDNVTNTGGVNIVCAFCNIHETVNAVTARIDYHFNWVAAPPPAPPVVAKY